MFSLSLSLSLSLLSRLCEFTDTKTMTSNSYKGHVNDQILQRFVRGRVVVRTPRRFSLSLPTTANEVLKYIATLSVITGTKMKLIPASSIKRRFVDIHASGVNLIFGDDVECFDDLFKKDALYRMTGSSRVTMGSQKDGSKQSISTDGIAYRVCVHAIHERSVLSHPSKVIDRRAGGSKEFVAKTKNQHPRYKKVENIEALPPEDCEEKTVGVDFGYVPCNTTSLRLTFTMHSISTQIQKCFCGIR